MERSCTALNRTALAAVGLVLLLGGAWPAVTRAPWAASLLPSWWPDPGAHTALVDRRGLADLRTTDWWTPSAVAGSLAATVLLAVWCFGQLRGGARSGVPLPAPGSTLRTRALEHAVTRDAVAIGGVTRCRTRVTHVRARRKQLHVHLRVWLRPDAAPAAVLPALAELAARTGTALAPYDVHTRVRLSAHAFSARAHRKRHVR
ncbi:hypothetical protein [Streptomyces beigongshangae]|uniref:hypothetical protein n=1 Tax=Streptomyces beigongshangae TaxID=2841597 RepID=UPI001C8450EA|nr:hypothetical protein [Streptomyces sp. REN17]